MGFSVYLIVANISGGKTYFNCLSSTDLLSSVQADL